MSGKLIGSLAFYSVAFALLCTAGNVSSYAEDDMGINNNDPLPTIETLTIDPSNIDKIEVEHDKKVEQIEAEYKQRFAPYSIEASRIRELAANLKEARMVMREDLDDLLMEAKLQRSKKEFERLNPYVMKVKARQHMLEQVYGEKH